MPENDQVTPNHGVVPPAKWRPWIVFGISVLVYLNSFGNSFVWDDQALIVQNPVIRDFGRIPGLLTSPMAETGIRRLYYRPIEQASYALDFHVSHLSPFAYHLSNTLLHAGAAALLYQLLLVLFANSLAAFLGALLFAVHPIQTESVTYLSSRSYPLSGLFLLLSLLWFVRDRGKGFTGFRWGSLGAGFAALLSHEQAVVLFPLIVLLDLSIAHREREDLKASWEERLVTRYVPYAGVTVLFFGLRWLAIGQPGMNAATGIVPMPLRMLTMAEVVVRYFGMWIAPFHQHMIQQFAPVESFGDPIALGALLLDLGIIGGAVFLARKIPSAWPVSFGLGWFFVCLIPYSNVTPLYDFLAERWLYLPSMGIAAALGWAIARWAKKKRQTAFATSAAALVVLSALTILRNVDWKDPLALYGSTYKYAQDSPLACALLAGAYQDAGQTDRAVNLYRQALALEPPPESTGTSDSLDARFQRAWRRQIDYGALRNNLGNLYRQTGKREEAIAEFQKAIAMNPRDATAYNSLGLALEEMRKPADAERAYESAVQADPAFPAGHSNLGNFYFRRNDFARAAREYQTAIQLNPMFVEAHNNLGSAYLRLGRRDLAEAEYRRALSLSPGNPQVLQNLQVLLASPPR